MAILKLSRCAFKAVVVAAFLALCAASAHAITIGNDLISRQYATDQATSGVFVVDFSLSQSGALTDILTYGQGPDASGYSSAGLSFNAYVLRLVSGSTYTVLFDTGSLTVGAVGLNTFALSGFNVQTGDLIGHYGQGIPLDINQGAGSVYFPSSGGAPSVGQTITLGSGDYPLYPQDRTYSIAAELSSQGVTTQAVGVPDSGSTVALLGLAMTAIGVARRKLS